MKKTIISAAVAGAILASGVASANTSGPSVYGQINLSGERVSDSYDATTMTAGERVSDSYDATTMTDDSVEGLNSRNTFIGVKGAEALDVHNLDLVYDVQLGFDYDSASDDEDFKLRKADVGFAGDMFSVHAGRIDNPYASLTKEGDLFKNSMASANSVFESGYLEHMDKTVAGYLMPNQDLIIGASYTHESDQDEEKFNVGGDTFDAYTLTAKYNMGMMSMYAGYANFDIDNGLTHSDTDFYKIGTEVHAVENMHLNLSAEKMDWSNDSRTNILAQAGYDVTDKVMLKAGLAHIGSTDMLDSGSMFALGADYKLGSNTTVGASYASIDTDTGQNLDGYMTASSTSNDGLTLSLTHNF